MSSWQNRIVGYSEERVDQLLASPLNWRIHPKAQADALLGVLSEVGIVQNVLCNKRNSTVIDGHLRISLALQQGQETVPVTWVDLSEEEEALILATLDPLSAMAGTDSQKLEELLRGVTTGDAALQALLADVARGAGIVPAMVIGEGGDEFDTTLDAAQTRVQYGDLWQCGRHRVLCGDSTKAEDVGRLMGDGRIDLVITDPPYGVSYADKNKFLNAISRGNRIQEPIENDHGDIQEIAETVWRPAFQTLHDVMRSGASFYVFSPQGGDQMMMMMMMSAVLPVRHELIWLKNNHVLGRADYAYKHEPILYGWKAGAAHTYYGGFQTSIFAFDKPQKSDLHPTMKPVDLIIKFIENSSKRNDSIGDWFLGSGTTLIAAERTGRRCYGCEIDPHYCAVILRRWEAETGQQAALIERQSP